MIDRIGRKAWIRTGAVALLTWSGHGAAQGEPVRIHLEAPSDCVSEEDFVRQVLARTDQARLAEPEELARSVRVEITLQADGTYAGHLEFTARDADPVERYASAPACAELVQALVLMTALGLEAQRPVSGGEPEEHSEKPSDDKAEHSNTEPVDVPPHSEITPNVAEDHPIPPPTNESHLRLAVGADYQLVSVWSPQPAQGALVFGQTRLRQFAGRVSLGWATSGDATVSNAHARFDWIGGRIEGCPVVLGSSALSVAPCVGVESGALRAQGLDGGVIAQGTARWTGWFAGLASARLNAEIGRFVGDLGLGATVPVTRTRYLISSPTTPLYSVPSVGWWMLAGMGVVVP